MLAKDDHRSGGSSHDIKIHLFWGNRLSPSTSGEITWIYSLIFSLSSFIHPKRFKSDTLTWRFWKVTPPKKEKFLLWVQFLTSTWNFTVMSIQPTIYPTLSQLQQVSCDFSPLKYGCHIDPRWWKSSKISQPKRSWVSHRSPKTLSHEDGHGRPLGYDFVHDSAWHGNCWPGPRGPRSVASGSAPLSFQWPKKWDGAMGLQNLGVAIPCLGGKNHMSSLGGYPMKQVFFGKCCISAFFEGLSHVCPLKLKGQGFILIRFYQGLNFLKRPKWYFNAEDWGGLAGRVCQW